MNPIWGLCQNRGFISRKLVEQMSPRQDCQASSLHGGVLPGNRLCPGEVPLKQTEDVEVVNQPAKYTFRSLKKVKYVKIGFIWDINVGKS